MSPLYRPIQFVSEFHSMSNNLTSEIHVETASSRRVNKMCVKFHENWFIIDEKITECRSPWLNVNPAIRKQI